jgi:hypothetical protein
MSGQQCIICHVRERRGYIVHTQDCPQFRGQSQRMGEQQADAQARYDLFVSRLERNPRHRDRYTCPSCGDQSHGGLKVDPGRDGPMFWCFGCEPRTPEAAREIVEAAGLAWSDIRPPRERRERPPTGAADPEPVAPVGLDDALKVYRRWLHLDDDATVLVVAATVVANDAEGDPLWTLLVGPPSSGKTEALQGIAGLRYVHSAATVTESALLSGVSKRDRDKDATGGLLRQIDKYGIILCKDFTSVLSQNKDNAAAALAALREVYDGAWSRPTGAGGGRVLHWRGKCGLVGGVTGSIDRYGQVIGALGDRFLLLRLPDVSPEDQAAAALAQVTGERRMRTELAEAMLGLIAGARHGALGRDLTADETGRLVRLATFTARGRTVVERNGYTNEVLVMPQPEGPARLVKQMRRLYSGLEAIGVDPERRWRVLDRVALDCLPVARLRVLRVLLAAVAPVGTGDVARGLGVDWKTAWRHLGDCRLLELAAMDIEESGGFGTVKARYWWSASEWLRNHFPSGTVEDKYPPSGRGSSKGEVDQVVNDALLDPPYPSSTVPTGGDSAEPGAVGVADGAVGTRCGAPGCGNQRRRGYRTCADHSGHII